VLLRSQYQKRTESITLLSVSTKKNGCFREAWGNRRLNRKTLCSLLIRIVCEIHLSGAMKNHWRFPLKADDNCQSFYTWHCNLLINERSFTGIHKRHPFVLNTGNISSIWKRILYSSCSFGTFKQWAEYHAFCFYVLPTEIWTIHHCLCLAMFIFIGAASYY